MFFKALGKAHLEPSACFLCGADEWATRVGSNVNAQHMHALHTQTLHVAHSKLCTTCTLHTTHTLSLSTHTHTHARGLRFLIWCGRWRPNVLRLRQIYKRLGQH